MNIQAYGISIFKDRHIGKCTFHVQYHPWNKITYIWLDVFTFTGSFTTYNNGWK